MRFAAFAAVIAAAALPPIEAPRPDKVYGATSLVTLPDGRTAVRYATPRGPLPWSIEVGARIAHLDPDTGTYSFRR